MSIKYLGCAYSLKFPINLNGKSKNILVMKWFVHFSDGARRTYQVTLYNTSNQKKYETISKPFSSKSKKKETTYIQINNLDIVKRLQAKDDTIKITIKYKDTDKKPDPYNTDSEVHFIDPKAFVDTKKTLFYLDRPHNYFLIEEYLIQYLTKTEILTSPECSESPSHKPDPEKENKETTQLALLPSNSFSEISLSKIQPISSCCNLKIITGIIFAITTIIIANFYE